MTGACTTQETGVSSSANTARALSQEIDGMDILAAMARFSYPDFNGRQLKALNTTDRRRMYVEDYYGDGSWREIGTVKDRVPVYGLRLIESCNGGEGRK